MANILEIVTRGRNETRDMFDDVRKGSDSVKQGLAAFREEADKSTKTWQISGAEIGKMAASFLTAQAVWAGAQKVWGALVAFVGDSIKEFTEAEAVQRRLTVAIRNQGEPVERVSQQYDELAATYQRTTKHSADLVKEQMALLTQVGGVYPEKMDAALQASADLAAGLGIDLKQATMLVGKAFAGEVGSLSRFGIVIDEARVKTEGADAVLSEIQKRFGGQAQAELDTYAGKVEQMGNAWADVKEGLGEVILTHPLLEAQMRNFETAAQNAGGAADVWRQALDRTLDVFGPLGARIRQDLGIITAWAERTNEAARAQRQAAGVPVPAIFKAGPEINTAALALQRFNEQLDADAEKAKAAKEAAEAHQKQLEAIRETLTGRGAIESMRLWVAEVQRVGGVSRLSVEAQDAYNKVLESGVGYLLAAGRAVPHQAFQDWLTTTKTLTPEVNKSLGDMIDKLTTIKALAPPAAVSLADTLGPLKKGLEGMPELFKQGLLTPAESFNNDLLAMARDNAGQLAEIGEEIGSRIGGWFGSVMSQSMALLQHLVAAGRDGAKGLAGFMASPAGRNMVGGIGLGMDTFSQGYSLGGLTSNRAVGTALGAGSGAATGAMVGTWVMPGLGTVAGMGIGALAGAIGGWFASNKRKKEEEAALKEMQGDLLETFKGFDNLKKVAAEVGINIDKAFDMKDRKGALKTIEAFAEALDKKNQRLEAVAMAQAIVTEKTSLFAAGLKDATTITDENQAAFDRLGRQFVATFQAGIRETGDFFGTMQQIGPGLDQLAALQEKLGFTSSDTLTRLMGFRDVVTANADVGQSIALNTGLMEAYKAAGMLTRETLLDFAADAIANYRTLTDRQVDSNTAMILQQKELQLLWEAQKKYGSITDEATLALLKQAEAQGVVGEQNRSVNDRMLETLIGIRTAVSELADVFRNELPEAARLGAEGIESQFRDRRYRIPVDFEFPDEVPGDRGRPDGYAIGGTVPYTPGGRVVRVAEAGTEHIMSTRQVETIAGRIVERVLSEAMGGTGGPVTVHNYIGDRHVDSVVATAANRGLRNGTIRVPARQVHEQVF